MYDGSFLFAVYEHSFLDYLVKIIKDIELVLKLKIIIIWVAYIKYKPYICCTEPAGGSDARYDLTRFD